MPAGVFELYVVKRNFLSFANRHLDFHSSPRKRGKHRGNACVHSPCQRAHLLEAVLIYHLLHQQKEEVIQYHFS